MRQQQLFETASGAKFSPCGKYRYALWRIWDETKPLVMFIGLNPSTANASTDDPTIRRVKGIAKSWGYGGVYMMNCFPLVSPHPEDLIDFIDTPFHDVEDLVNVRWLLETSRKCADVVFAWGNFKIVKDGERDKMLSGYFPNAKALVINKDGSPRHPLYVPASVRPISFTITQ